MRFFSRVGVASCAVAMWAGQANGDAEFVLQPISASGTHMIVGNEIRLTGANQRVFLQVQLKGWPGGLRTYQAKLDASGYGSGVTGLLTPANQACAGRNATGHGQCAAALGPGSLCNVPATGTATSCEPGFIDRNNSNFVFFNMDIAFLAVDISSENYRYTAGLNPPGVATYAGTPKYGGVLVVDVPADAQGTFTINFQAGGESLMADQDSNEIFPLILTPAKITILCASNANCNDNNNCTTDSCNVATGICSNSPNYNTTTHCCNPATGGLTVLTDGIQCTDDVCNTATGQVTHPNSAAFTPCGNPANSQCDHPDSCDGAGNCNPRIEPSGAACGSSTVTECNLADTCDGAGTCQANLRPAGFACGSSSTTPCDAADTCNGVGTCLTNTTADNTPCSTGQFCITDERCTSGACGGGSPTVCDDLLTCTTDTCNEVSNQCDYVQNADTCLIDDVCYLPGEQRPTNTCEECNPSMNATDWSVRADGSTCNDGDACTGTGRPGIGVDTCTGGVCSGMVDPECNADCEFAVPVIVGANTSNNNNAGVDDGEASCQPNSNNDVWFKYTANCDGVTFMSTSGSTLAPSNDTVLNLYTNCPELGGTEIACDDDSGVGLQSALTFATTSGTTYWIRVAGFEENKGGIILNIRPVDDCLIDGVCYADGALNPDNDCLACIPEISTTEWSVRPEGSSCGNSSDTECDSPDACDGAGFCEVNYKPDNTLCSDEVGGNVCTFDFCEGGACIHPPVALGVPCGDPTDRECDDPDQCNGGGLCDPRYEDAGVACGDTSDTECTDPDTCDGTGGCLVNHVPDGTVCDDVNLCTGGDECVSGLCVGDGLIQAPEVYGISSRHLRITVDEGNYNLPVSLHVTSPTWPCLDDYVDEFRHLSDFSNRDFTFPTIWGTFDLIDPDIFPSSTYYVVAECNGFFSQPGIAITYNWGDVDGDGDTDALDIAAVINVFKQLPGNVGIPAADLYPCLPDGRINALDIVMDVNAFKLIPYPCDPPCHP